jgi:hypothetical protein
MRFSAQTPMATFSRCRIRTWRPLLSTPNHPEYPSAHACHTPAVAEALESFFGPGRTSFSLDNLMTGETRYYDRFKDVVDEVNNARV